MPKVITPKGVSKHKTSLQSLPDVPSPTAASIITSPTVVPVNSTPKVILEKNPQEEMVTFVVDRKMTDGGIRINGKLYVGPVRVTKTQAEDLQRIQEEYFETKEKMMDKNAYVRMKSDYQKEVLFLADPKENEMKKNFSRDYGLLGPVEWSYCKPAFKQHLLEQRMALYGY